MMEFILLESTLMEFTMHKSITGLALTLLMLAPLAASAAGDVKCSMTFTMSGWSAFYKTASGTGTIKCSNGQSAAVKLDAKGGGLHLRQIQHREWPG